MDRRINKKSPEELQAYLLSKEKDIEFHQRKARVLIAARNLRTAKIYDTVSEMYKKI